MNHALLLLGKATLLLSAALLVAPLLRRTSAVTRHRLWTGLFAAMLALPLLAFALPALDVPVPIGGHAVAGQTDRVAFSQAADTPQAPSGTEAATGLGAAASHRVSPGPGVSPVRAVPRDGRLVPWLAAAWSIAPAALLVVWLAGTLGAVFLLGVSLVRVRRLARGAEAIADPAWLDAAAAIGARLAARRPVRLVASPRVRTPMAGGIWRPTIFLPASARRWAAECRDIVLAHEMVHLAARDPLRHLVTRLTLALYWFHPLAWVAARQATVAREQACDEAVLALGTRRSAYASVLLDLSDQVHPPAAMLAALPMAQRLHLEKRLMTILDAEVRPAARHLILVPLIGLVLLTVVVAAVQPAPVAPLAGTPSAQRPPAATAVTPAPRPASSLTATAGPVQAPAPQKVSGQSSACELDLGAGSSFSGTTSSTDSGGVDFREWVGRLGGDLVIRKNFGDLRVCMVAEGASEGDRPSQLFGRGTRVVLEAGRGRAGQRLEVGGQLARPAWKVDGQDRAFDAAAQSWRDRMLALLDTTWEIATLRGRVSTLRGQISSIHGQRSSLQGQISSLRGEVSSMRGEASSARGHESSLNGQISSIRGHLSSLRGEISSERGAISSLNASTYGASDADRARIAADIAGHEARIKKLEVEIRDYGAEARVAAIERERDAYNADGRVAAIEGRIKSFDLAGKVAEIERRITTLNVDGTVAGLERQIGDLHADRRIAELEPRQQRELASLEAAVASIR